MVFDCKGRGDFNFMQSLAKAMDMLGDDLRQLSSEGFS